MSTSAGPEANTLTASRLLDSPLEIEQAYPNQMARIMLAAMIDVVGLEGARAALKHADLNDLADSFPAADSIAALSFTDIASIQIGLENTYGVRGGRVLAQRTGREMFRYAQMELMQLLGIADLPERPIHLVLKMRICLEVIAESLKRSSNRRIQLRENDNTFLWMVDECPICWHRQSDLPCCNMSVGFLEQAMEWVSKDRRFSIKEIECRAAKSEKCVIAIQKVPVSQ
jgi:predicted hydrocarbon binding protein